MNTRDAIEILQNETEILAVKSNITTDGVVLTLIVDGNAVDEYGDRNFLKFLEDKYPSICKNYTLRIMKYRPDTMATMIKAGLEGFEYVIGAVVLETGMRALEITLGIDIDEALESARKIIEDGKPVYEDSYDGAIQFVKEDVLYYLTTMIPKVKVNVNIVKYKLMK